MKFSVKVGNGPLNKRLNFGGDPNHRSGYASGSRHCKTCLGGGMYCPSASSLKMCSMCRPFCRITYVAIHWHLTLARVSATSHCRSNLQQTQRLLPFEQTPDGLYLPLLRYTASVDFFSNLPSPVLLHILC